MPEIEIKRLSDEHLASVAKLEAECFSRPWGENELRMLTGSMGVGFVALDGSRIAAFGGMMTVLDEGQITSVVTSPEYRRIGLGRRIMDALESFSRENGINFLSLEVRESNLAARGLYKACGLEEAGIRKNFYDLPTENAVVMIKKL